MNEKDNSYPTPRTVEEARQVWSLPSAADFHRSAPATPEAQDAAAEEKAQEPPRSFYEDDPLNTEPPRAAPNAEAGTDTTAPPQEERPLDELAEILDRETPFDLADLRERAKRAGAGVDLGLRFYNHLNALNGGYSRSPMNMKFRGITVFAARTGGGKTLFAVSTAAHTLATKPDYHVVFLSLEESKAVISQKILAAFLDFTPGDDRERADVLSLDTIETFIRGEPIQAREEIEDYIDTGRRPWDTRIKAAAHTLADRLTVIDIESFEEARARFAQTFESADKAADLAKVWTADQSTTVRGMIAHYRRKYGDKVLFFVDYAQRLHNRAADDRRNAATYKEIQAVMADLISEARAGAVVFLAAQMNRDNSKEVKNDAAKEFFGAIPEQLREAADIEQAAEIILYLTIDRESTPNVLNMRVLKYRNGDARQYAGAPIDWRTRAACLADLREPTYRPDAKPQRITTTAPAEEEDDDEPTIPTPKPKQRTLPRAYKGGKK